LLPIREIPSPDELAAKGAVPVVTTEPQILLEEMFLVSGEIPRVLRSRCGVSCQL
jgi:hypothetical protein